MKEIETVKAPQAIGPYVQGIIAGDFIFTSGQIPLDPETGKIAGETIKEQAEQCIQNLKAVLCAANSNLDCVIKTTCFLRDMAGFEEFNRVYANYFSTRKPARSCVSVRELPKGVQCEIEAIAFSGLSRKESEPAG